MNVKIFKNQFSAWNEGWPIVQIDYYGYIVTLIANEPLSLTKGPAEQSGKKAIVFTYQPGRTFGRVIDFGEYGAEDYLTGASDQKRESYLARAMNIRDGKGRLTALDPYTANHWSIKFLWGYTPRLNSKYIKR